MIAEHFRVAVGGALFVFAGFDLGELLLDFARFFILFGARFAPLAGLAFAAGIGPVGSFPITVSLRRIRFSISLR